MITETIITAGLSLLGGLFNLLPTDTITYPVTTGFGTTVGEMVGPFNSVVPIAELAGTLSITVTVLLPALLAYRGIMFIWGKVPVFGS